MALIISNSNTANQECSFSIIWGLEGALKISRGASAMLKFPDKPWLQEYWIMDSWNFLADVCAMLRGQCQPTPSNNLFGGWSILNKLAKIRGCNGLVNFWAEAHNLIV